MLIYDLATNPTITVDIDTDETVVNISTWEIADDGSRSAVPLSVSVATQYAGNLGRWDWHVSFTTRPVTLTRLYETLFSGVTYGQKISIKWQWQEDLSNYKGVVYIDTTGAGVPLSSNIPYTGCDFRPVSNIADAKIIAARINTKKFFIKGNVTLAASFAGYELEGIGSKELNVVTLGSQNVLASVFRNMNITGTSGGQLFYSYECWMNNITGLNCHAESVKFDGAFVMAMGGEFKCAGCTQQGFTPVTFDMSVVSGVGIVDANGLFVFSNLTNALGAIAVSGTHISTLMATITAGTVFMGGRGKAINLGTPTSYTMYVGPDDNYDVLLSGHVATGTAGKKLGDIPVNPLLTTDSRLDNLALIKTETDKLQNLLGLSNENLRIYNQVYDANNNMTSASARVYPTAADLNADINVIAEYLVTATFAGNNCTLYKAVKI